MSTIDTSSALQELPEFIDQINSAAQAIGKEEKVFLDREAVFPNYTCFEAGFIKTTSWLYAQYQEVGGINVDYLLDKQQVYGPEWNKLCKLHLRNVCTLRTVLQHSLDLTSKRNQGLKWESEKWFQALLKTSEPQHGLHWHICMNGIISEAKDFLLGLLFTIQSIKSDDLCDSIIYEWNFKSRRYHPPHEFDQIIEIVSYELGFTNIDTVKIRKMYYSRWSKELSVKTGDINFETEARKLIEQTLFHHSSITLPITGKDIMEEFNLPPGKEVGRLHAKAKEFFDEKRSDSVELLEKLSEWRQKNLEAGN